MQISLHFREGRGRPWEARWWMDRDKPRSKFFQSKADRARWVKRAKRDLAQYGKRALALNPKLMEKWMAAQAILGDADPLEVAMDWAARQDTGTARRFEDAAREYLDLVEERFADDERTGRFRRVLERFETAAAGKRLDAITPQMIEQWLTAQRGFKATTKRNWRRELSTFFRDCVKQGWTTTNPVAAVAQPEAAREEPGTIGPETVRAIFAANADDARATTVLALGLFGGFRSSAASRIEWSDLNFAERGILTPARKTKKERRQFIQGFPDALWAWLERAEEGHFASAIPEPTGDNYADRLALNQWKRHEKRRLEHIRRAALLRAGVMFDREAQATFRKQHPGEPVPSLKLLPHNWARHSFVTAHLALYKDPGRTALLVSHKNDPKILHDAYNGIMSEADAERYFAVLP